MYKYPFISDIEVRYDTIQMTNAASGAGVFNGLNNQFGWSSHFKTNTGLGTVGGHHNQTPNNINLLNDLDIIDATINDQDIMWGGQTNI